MIARRLGFQEFLASGLALGKKLANPLLLLVGKARWHRASGDQDRRQMSEPQRTDQQAGHDLVTNAEQGSAFEHAVAQRDSGR